MENAFARYHPATNFIFFLCAIVCSMFVMHPFFILISVFFSALYYFLLNGAEGINFFGGTIIFALIIGFINPLFNASGDTVLFFIFERPYTLEALEYGFAAGGMFFSVIMWFSCGNKIITSDKFIYIFGRIIPAFSLILSMVLRFVPLFKTRMHNINAFRRCIGKSPFDGDIKLKIKNSGDALSALLTQSLEGAVTTADSMKSRGYGCARRKYFAIYKITAADIIVLAAIAFFIVVILCKAAGNVLYVEYLPKLYIYGKGTDLMVSLLGYCGFSAIPSVLHISEEIKWYILRSKI